MFADRAWWIPAENEGKEKEYVWPFINKEFGLRLFYGGNQKEIQLRRISVHGSALIFIDSSIKNLGFLDDFPSRSVNIFYVSDETYSSIKVSKVLMNRATRNIYRDYPIHPPRNIRTWPVTILHSAIRAIRVKLDPLKVLKAIFAGIVLAWKQLMIIAVSKFMLKEVKKIPLGYTGGFANEFIRFFKLEEEDSIIDFSIKNSKKIVAAKTSTIFFTGQIGKCDRQLMLLEANRLGLNIGPIHDGFGGPPEPQLRERAIFTHFDGLRRSLFSLVPPGNYSPESFRMLESLLLIALPLAPRSALSNPFYLSKFGDTWRSFQSAAISGDIGKELDYERIVLTLIGLRQEIYIVANEVGLTSRSF